MGGCDSKGVKNSIPSNVCGTSDAIGDIFEVPGACDFIGGGPTVCPNSEEWADLGGGSSCGVASLDNGREFGDASGACIDACCTWPGRRKRCQRIAFVGDPLKCCLRDQDLKTSCFDGTVSNDHLKKTCDPVFRGFSASGCQNIMQDNCSNDVDLPFKQKWIGDAVSSDCRRYAFEADQRGSPEDYIPVIDAMVRRYLITENAQILPPTDLSFDPFLQEVINICKLHPGSCDEVLRQKCAGVKREDLAINVSLANICGCFMPDTEYQRYAQFLEKECDPICTLNSVIHQGTPAGEEIKCTKSICVMDNITIDVLQQSQVGGIQFSQLCGNCGSQGCQCVIADSSITSIDSVISGNITIEQKCGGIPTCVVTNPDDPTSQPQQVNCDDPNSTFQAGAEPSPGISTSNLVIIIVVLIIIALIIYFIASYVSGRQERVGREGFRIVRKTERYVAPKTSDMRYVV